MKSFFATLSAMLLLGNLAGCKVLMDTTADKEPIQAPPLKVTEKATPVQPEEITPANAQSKARQLMEELESDIKK